MRISDWSSDVCSSDLSSGLEALHTFGQRPEGAIESHILVDAVDGAGLAAADAAFGVTLAAMESTPDDIFLNGVVGHPEVLPDILAAARRSEEHTSELQSLMRISYAVFCLKKKKQKK